MKTAIIYGPRDVQVEEVDIPVIGPDDVLVQVKASGICGSDVHRYLGTEYGRGACTYPMNSGHEYCGDVVQIGNRVKGFREGEKVTLGKSWASGKRGQSRLRGPQTELGVNESIRPSLAGRRTGRHAHPPSPRVDALFETEQLKLGH